MNLLKICTVGFKILLAVGTGLAVFAGIEQAVKIKREDDCGIAGSDNEQQMNGGIVAKRDSDKFLLGLRATQDTCEKVLTVIGSLVTVAENISSIFNGGYSYQSYNTSPWGCSSMYNPGGHTTIIRRNPFIMEVRPSQY